MKICQFAFVEFQLVANSFQGEHENLRMYALLHNKCALIKTRLQVNFNFIFFISGIKIDNLSKIMYALGRFTIKSWPEQKIWLKNISNFKFS